MFFIAFYEINQTYIPDKINSFLLYLITYGSITAAFSKLLVIVTQKWITKPLQWYQQFIWPKYFKAGKKFN